MGVVVRAHGVDEAAGRYERPLGDGALAHDALPGVGRHLVGIAVEVAAYAVDAYGLRDAAGDQAVEESLFAQGLIVRQGRSVGHQQRTIQVGLDGRLVGREGEEELVEAPHVLACLHGAVLGEVLRECDHERPSAVEDVDLLPLPLGEGIGEAYRGYGHSSAQSGEEGAADAYEPEVAFDIFKTFEFHTANVKRLMTCSPEFSGNPPDAVPRGLAAGVSFSCGHAH